MQNKLATAAVAIYAVTNVMMVGYLILLQLDAVQQRHRIRSQNDFLVCILQTQPADRTKALINSCREKTIGRTE